MQRFTRIFIDTSKIRLLDKNKKYDDFSFFYFEQASFIAEAIYIICNLGGKSGSCKDIDIVVPRREG